jgi:hypothetical protein
MGAMPVNFEWDSDKAEEYDFSKGTRGKYAQRYAKGCNVVVLDPEVTKEFPDSKSVNDALKSLAHIIKAHQETATSNQ